MAQKSAVDVLGKKGISFEKAVTAIQQMMDPQSVVTHNERIRDIHGHIRQFDVVIRARSAGQDILGVIECKDLKKRVGTPEVDAFVTKARAVNANIILIASKRGFTKPALEEAKYHGIGTLSLLPADPQDSGFSIGITWYATFYYWSKRTMVIDFVKQRMSGQSFSPKEVTWCGWPVIDWFDKELVTTHQKEERLGILSSTLKFGSNRRFHIGSRIHFVKGITFRALRVCKHKKKWVQFFGQGFYDWDKQRVTMPPKGEIVTSSFRFDFSDWEDCRRKVPTPNPLGHLLDGRFTLYVLHFDPHKEVVDLTKL